MNFRLEAACRFSGHDISRIQCNVINQDISYRPVTGPRSAVLARDRRLGKAPFYRFRCTSLEAYMEKFMHSGVCKHRVSYRTAHGVALSHYIPCPVCCLVPASSTLFAKKPRFFNVPALYKNNKSCRLHSFFGDEYC